LLESSPVRLSAICIVEWQNLRQLRLELEKLAPLLADGDVLIWVDAEDVTAAGMQQLKTLLEIMVIA
jgi:urease accessory protein UreE